MRPSYLEQYRSAGPFGDFVWSAVYSEGALEEGTALWEDAYAVAREAMERARQNIEVIVDFLRREHYIFFGVPPVEEGSAGEPWLLPGRETPEQLQRLDALAGPLPLSLRAWWEVVGTVSLQGVFEDEHGEGKDPTGWPQPMCDPLMVDPLGYVLQQVDEQLDEGADASREGGVLVELSPDIYHKANQSGGAPYAVCLPARRMDVPLLNVLLLLPVPAETQRPYVEIETNETFGQYLRRSFQWAGFPGFAFLPDPQMERLRPLFEKMLPL